MQSYTHRSRADKRKPLMLVTVNQAREFEAELLQDNRLWRVELACALVLLRHSLKKGHSFISLARVAKIVGTDLRSTRRAVERLCRKHQYFALHRHGVGKQPNEYRPILSLEAEPFSKADARRDEGPTVDHDTGEFVDDAPYDYDENPLMKGLRK